jgi:hypothetical protein
MRVLELAERAQSPTRRRPARSRLGRRSGAGAVGPRTSERRRCGPRGRSTRSHVLVAADAVVADGVEGTSASAIPCVERAGGRSASESRPRSATLFVPRERGNGLRRSRRYLRASRARKPSALVQNRSATSRRTLRLSTRRVRPPVPGSTPSSGTSGSDTAEDPSSTSMISVARELPARTRRRQPCRSAPRSCASPRFTDASSRPHRRLVRVPAEVDLEPVRR